MPLRHRLTFLTLVGLLHLAPAEAGARSCRDLFERNAVGSVRWVYTDIAMDHQLASQKRDESSIVRVRPDHLDQYAIRADREGRVVFIKSGSKLKTSESELLISIWNLQNGKSGGFYVATEEANRQLGHFRHSSFNRNAPVLGAWTMKAVDGKITEIIDGSGHYLPSPLHMYLTVAHLSELGFSLSQASVVFQYGAGPIHGLKIEAERFLMAVNKRSVSRLGLWSNVGDDPKSFSDFLDFISKNSRDVSTKTLILLYRIRNAAPEAVEPLLVRLGRQLSSGKFSEAELKFMIAAVFEMKTLGRFSYYPIYYTENYARLDLLLARYQRILLGAISDRVQHRRVASLLKSRY